MIIKMRTRSGNNNVNEAWRLIDGVSDVGFHKEQQRASLVEKFSDESVAGVEWVEDNDEAGSRDEYAQISFANSRGGFSIVLTNCPVYLLNDAGKTIERIN